MSTEAAPSIGRRYRLLDPLGHGGMGQVWSALDRLTGQTVALKRILLESAAAPSERRDQAEAKDATLFAHPPREIGAANRGLTWDNGALAVTAPTPQVLLPDVRNSPAAHQQRLALAQEFQMLATLHHPNIIGVLDYGFDAERHPYFTMELLQGARPLLPLAVALPRKMQIDLLIQILSALRYLHRRGILHRDFYI